MRPKSIPEEQNYRRVVEVRRGRAAYMGLGAEGRGGGAGLAVITGRSRRGVLKDLAHTHFETCGKHVLHPRRRPFYIDPAAC